MIAALALAYGGWQSPEFLPAAQVRADLGPILAANLLPVQQLFGLPLAISVYWTLAYEICFYGLVSLAFLARIHRRYLLLAWVALLFALGIEAGIRIAAGAYLPQQGSLYNIGLMFAGSVAYRWLIGEVSPRAALGVAGLALATAVATTPPGSPGEYPTRIAALAAFGLGLWLHRRPMPIIVRWLGRISYSVYLLHVIAIAIVPSTGSTLADSLLWIALTLALATATERWIERPGIALGKRLAARLQRLGTDKARTDLARPQLEMAD